MSDVLVRVSDPSLDSIVLDGTAYDVDLNGEVAVPEAMDFASSPSVLTTDQLGTLVTAGRVVAGAFYFCSSMDHPVWRNAANTGWVDGIGDPVTMS